VRWARLRRATFAPYYAPELLTTSLFTLVAAAIAAPEPGVESAIAFLLAALVWYGAEAALARAAGWPLAWSSALAWIARDVALPWLWVQGWNGKPFVWRGNVMSVDDDALATDGPGPFPPA
jgi:ceramide glucosyltransferase